MKAEIYPGPLTTANLLSAGGRGTSIETMPLKSSNMHLFEVSCGDGEERWGVSVGERGIPPGKTSAER